MAGRPWPANGPSCAMSGSATGGRSSFTDIRHVHILAVCIRLHASADSYRKTAQRYLTDDDSGHRNYAVHLNDWFHPWNN